MNWHNGLQQYIISYYQGLFTATSTCNEEVIECASRTLSQAQNLQLLREQTEEEVKIALIQMNRDKAPGPDGMTLAFFQKHWEIVGGDIIRLTKHFFQ